jgi:hypothetical protein
MSKLPFLTLAAAVLVLPTLVAPTPALAQRVNEIIVYGTDPCPRSTDDEVVVCARKPESHRYQQLLPGRAGRPHWLHPAADQPDLQGTARGRRRRHSAGRIRRIAAGPGVSSNRTKGGIHERASARFVRAGGY